jgi:AraC family transcriptional regulator of adaptative response/methylated-DNA-[protein]-cysteine methyltransferase
MPIRFTLTDTPLGRLLLAATERGVCTAHLGDADEALLAALQRRYPRRELHRDDAGLRDWAAAVVAGLRGEAPAAVPLDLLGTPFQRRVWEQLCAIPRGQTRTYRQIAEALGRPGAARAVGRACGDNPVAVLVPCHRVVRGDGGLGGYAGGLSRKQALLQLEGVVVGRPAALSAAS